MLIAGVSLTYTGLALFESTLLTLQKSNTVKNDKRLPEKVI